MRKEVRKMTALALSSAMIMGMSTMVLADVTRDDDSQFTTGLEQDTTTATSGLESFNLIKDYDSVNATGTTDPKSQSPAETFVYTIKPYKVWNAGNTYADGVATPIDVTNMPMLKATAVDGMAVETSGTGAGRVLTIKQDVAAGKALKETADDNSNDTASKIELPTYTTVGDYWYVVEETYGKTTGVQYATNSANGGKEINGEGGFTRKYYIHVQVTDSNLGTGTAALKSNVTMHTIAPEGDTNAAYNANAETLYETTTGGKVNAIENKYYAGDLVIKKEVTGNAGDKSQYFEVTVVFTKPAGTIVNSDVPFTAMQKSTSEGVDTYTSTKYVVMGQDSEETYADTQTISWTGSGNLYAEKTATCKFYVKDGSEVTFSNIPYGINYTVQEKLPENDTYKNKIVFTDSKDAANTFDGVEYTTDTDAAAGALSADAKTAAGSITDVTDTITITNDKETKIDIGVVLSNAPYFALLFSAGIAAALSMRRLKKSIEE